MCRIATATTAKKGYAYRVNTVAYNLVRRNATLADRMNYWLVANQVSKAELARRAATVGFPYGVKISPCEIVNYTKGRCCPKTDKLAVLCVAMGVSQPWLTGYGPTKIDRPRRKEVR